MGHPPKTHAGLIWISPRSVLVILETYLTVRFSRGAFGKLLGLDKEVRVEAS